MSAHYKWAEHYSACRLQLDLPSLIRMSGLLGLCSGVGLIPLIIYLSAEAVTQNPASIAIIFLVAPLFGALNGAAMGIVAYPLYKWLSQRAKGQTYTGIFVGLVATDGTSQ
jgi:hypothetical protein